MRWPSQEADPFITARTPSFTDPGPSNLAQRLNRESLAAHAQVRSVRSILKEIATEALNHEDRGNVRTHLP
ncbi:hypothetical protein MPL3356_110107 [Mesorhizobium plurifarium]|uniref:Uncharacterized protein n=1 Tax=Mesorhizobium plurifarium TaxID=69974 RepID=A0A090DE49_MESPL|nr:hypothetical protein MPL3356_110107 [Mesorhizobium plurifarium]